MSIYKQATQLGLRISTVKGSLSAEQLFTLSMADLSSSIKALKKLMKTSDDDELSFLEDSTSVDPILSLSFELMKDIYNTKKDEAKAQREAYDIKAHNAKIDAALAELDEKEFKSLDREALLKLRK